MQGLAQPRLIAAAGLLLLAAGLLWSAFRHEKPERLPPDWVPVNERLAEPEVDGAADAAGVSDVSDVADGSGGAADVAADAGQTGAIGELPGAGAAEASPNQAEMTEVAVTPPVAAGFDINRATAAEWDELPGIGPAKARAIVEDRERNGPFRSIDDLARVKGIGPKLLERLREAIEARNAPGG